MQLFETHRIPTMLFLLVASTAALLPESAFDVAQTTNVDFAAQLKRAAIDSPATVHPYLTSLESGVFAPESEAPHHPSAHLLYICASSLTHARLLRSAQSPAGLLRRIQHVLARVRQPGLGYD